MIDTHTHLGDDAAEVLARARAAGVVRVVAVATTVQGARDALEHLGRVVAEVRVRVDHALLALMRLSSSATTDSSSLRKSGLGCWSSCPGWSSLGAQRPIHVE